MIKLENNKFLKGAIWNTLGSTMYGMNSFLTLAIVSRIANVEETGAFGIAFTTAQILYIVGLLGTNHYQQTDYKEKYSFTEYKRSKRIACLLMLIGCCISIIGLQFSGKKLIYTILLTTLMMLNAIGELYQSRFFQKNRLELSGSCLFFRTIWSLIVFFLIAAITRQITYAICLQIVTNIGVTLYYVYKYKSELIEKEYAYSSEKNENYRSLIVECFPLFISVLLMNIIINISKYCVELLMDDASQGYYNMIFIVAQAINLGSQFIFKPLLSKFATIIEQREKKIFYKELLRQIGFIVVLTIVSVTFIGSYGTKILGGIYNKNIDEYRTALVNITVAGGIFAIGQLMYYIFVLMREQKRIMYIYIIGMAFSTVIAYILVLKKGLEGAALSFILGQCLIVLLYICNLKAVEHKNVRDESYRKK